MTITFINKNSRTSPSVPFFHESDSPIRETLRQISIQIPGVTTSTFTTPDGLTWYGNVMCDTISTFSTYYENVANLHVSVEFLNYSYSQNPLSNFQNRRYIYGLDTPFTMTTTYNFPNGTANSSSLINGLAGIDYTNLSNNSVLTNTVTLIHTYTNSDAFNNGHFNDFEHATDLLSAGVTKTVTIDNA